VNKKRTHILSCLATDTSPLPTHASKMPAQPRLCHNVIFCQTNPSLRESRNWINGRNLLSPASPPEEPPHAHVRHQPEQPGCFPGVPSPAASAGADGMPKDTAAGRELAESLAKPCSCRPPPQPSGRGHPGPGEAAMPAALPG